MADIKFNCPECGHNLYVDENGAGMIVPCPECSKQITIPVPSPMPKARHANEPQSGKGSSNTSIFNRRTAAFSAIGTIFAVTLLVLLSLQHGYGRGKSIVAKMLDSAKRGEDTVKFWMDGAERIKLFNVVDFEILSERPLSEAIQGYVGGVKEHCEQLIDEREKAITEINEKGANYQKALPELEQKANFVPPEIEFVPHSEYNYSRDNPNKEFIENNRQIIIQTVNSYNQRFPESAWDSFNELLTRPGLSEERLSSIYGRFKDRLDSDRNDYNEALEFLNGLSASIKTEESFIKKYRDDIAKLDKYVSETGGIAYKVRINSTNKAGQPIVWIWTITTIPSPDGWKITYLYNPDEFEENADWDSIHLKLLSILGQ